MLQDIGEGFTVECGVDRNGNVAGHGDGQVGQNPVRAVLADDGDAAAFRPSLRLQPCGHAAHLVCSLGPGDVGDLSASDGLGQINGIGAIALPAVKALQWQVARVNGDRCSHETKAR